MAIETYHHYDIFGQEQKVELWPKLYPESLQSQCSLDMKDQKLSYLSLY